MKKQKLKTKLEFKFNVDEEVPELNFEVDEPQRKIKDEIKIQKKKKRGKTTSKLF